MIEPAPARINPYLWLLLGLAAFGYFWLAPVQQMSDASFTVPLSERMIYARSLDLAPVVRATPTAQLPFQDAQGDLPLHMVRKGEQQFYAYPLWTSVLIAPAVALMNAAGWRSVDLSDRYQPAVELQMQRVLAALLGSLIVLLLMRLSLLYTSAQRALMIGLLLVVGSSVSSTLSRALWAQTTATLLLCLALGHVLTRERVAREINAGWIGALLVLMVLVRQPLLFSAAALLAWVAYAQPQKLRAVLLYGALFALAAALFHAAVFGQLLAPSRYGVNLFTVDRVVPRAFSLLFAASRGLAVYLPLALLAMLAACVVPLDSRLRRLSTLALLAIAGQLLLLSFYRPWAGGGAYGPRLLAELTPWWVLLGALAIGRRSLRTSLLCGLAVLAAWQTLIHVRGSWSQATFEWNNVEPTYVAGSANYHGWRYPQFLAGVRDRPYPPVAAEPRALLAQSADFASAASDPLIDSDIGPATSEGRPISGPYPQLRFVFAEVPNGAEVLELTLHASSETRLTIFLNDQKVNSTRVLGQSTVQIAGEFRRGNARNNSIRLDCGLHCAEITLKTLRLVTPVNELKPQ